MRGYTNALSVINKSSGSDSGDIVYAINDTETNLNNGDKVWLNVISNEDEYKTRAGYGMYAENELLPYAIEHNMCIGQNKYIWNGSSYNSKNFTSTALTISVCPITRSWGMFFNTNKKVVFSNGTYILTPNGGILNDKYSINSNGICTYDHLTGEETVIAARPQSTYSTYYMDDDNDAIMFYTINTKTFDIYEDFHNPSEGHRTFTVSDNAYPLWVTNGLSNNSYFICNMNTVYPTRLSHNDQFVIYKLFNNTLTPADDLPASLERFVRRSNTWTYYQDTTKVLTILDLIEMRVHAWKVINNTFKELLNIPYTPAWGAANKPTDTHFAVFNDDMTQLATWYNYSSGSYTYHCQDIHHYNIIDGKWHVTSYAYNNEATLTGFATGEVNENNEVEIKTVLPPEVTMTFNITPDEDTFAYKGLTA